MLRVYQYRRVMFYTFKKCVCLHILYNFGDDECRTEAGSK